MADDYIGVRLGPELRAQLEQAAAASGVSLSDFVRASIVLVLQGYAQTGIPPELPVDARRLGMRIAANLLNAAIAAMPEDPDEAAARYGTAPPVGF